MSYSGILAEDYAQPRARVGAALAVGIAAAFGGAAVVGVFSGITGFQSAYAAILLGWIVGLAIGRAGRDTLVAGAATVLALAGSAAASVITVCIGAVRDGHVPAAIVAGHFWRAIPLLPHVTGWFGFACWALAAFVSWQTVRRHRHHRSHARSTATPPPSQQQ